MRRGSVAELAGANRSFNCTGQMCNFGADDLPERPLPFMWQAWKAWRVEHPPDG